MLGKKGVPLDGRAYAARALGLLGDVAGAPALRKAVAEPATRDESMLAEACARALVALEDAEAPDALAKGIEAWTAYYEDKVMGDAMRYSDWRRSTHVLAELLGAWAELAAPDADPRCLERSVVDHVLAPEHKVQTSERVPQDPSVTRCGSPPPSPRPTNARTRKPSIGSGFSMR